jgi:hypothetical protein
MKNYIRISLIVGVVVLAAVAVWWFTKTDTPAEVANLSGQVPLASVTPVAIAYDTPPADWKTYSSASAGYSVSYPADWTFGPCAPGCMGWAPPTSPSGQFVMGIIETEGTIEALLTSAEPYLAAKEEIKAGDNTWTKLTLQQPMTGDVVTSHFIEKDGILYEFGTATDDTALLVIYGTMIRSFTFMK